MITFWVEIYFNAENILIICYFSYSWHQSKIMHFLSREPITVYLYPYHLFASSRLYPG